MNSFLVVVCFTLLISVAASAHINEKLGENNEIISSNIIQSAFPVPLDHFRPHDPRTFSMVYHRNMDYYKYLGPIYIYLKDGGDTSTQWIEEGLMVDIARETNGALFTFDMRYFGTNIPTENATLENLQYLSSEQILQDLAELIVVIQQRHSVLHMPAILWGSGYGATVAAWGRKKFPHLVAAVWASSGIFKIDLNSYYMFDYFGFIMHSGDLECRNNVRDAMSTIEELLSVGGGGQTLQELFGLCHAVDSTDPSDMSYFYESLIDFMTRFIQQNHLAGVQNICNELQPNNNDTLTSLARWVNDVRGPGVECIDWSYNSFVTTHSNVDLNQPGTESGRRQWTYLQCTQSGLFEITDQYSWIPNRIPMSYRIKQCQDVLGNEYAYGLLYRANSRMANNFGSQNLRMTNAIYTNGWLDPMLYHGIPYTQDNDTFTINLYDFARSADLTSLDSSDPPMLTNAKEFIVKQITDWSDPLGIGGIGEK